jgi:hypothetical protein
MTKSNTGNLCNSALVARAGKTHSTSTLHQTSSVFDQVDPAVFMLGLPKSRPKLVVSMTIAILLGLTVAFLMIGVFLS